MKQIALQIMKTTGVFSAFRWINRRGVLILTYHRFSEREVPGRVSAFQLTEHLKILKENYRVLSLEEVAQNLQSGKTLPANTAVITIDDGYQDAFEIAFPLFKKFQIPATLFVITDFLDRKAWLWTDKARVLAKETKLQRIETADFKFSLNGNASRSQAAAKINEKLKRLPNDEKEKQLENLQKIFQVNLPKLPSREYSAISWSEAKEMDSECVKIESHTVSHPILPNVDDEKLNFELTNSKLRLQEILGREADLFCYPNGGFDARVKRFVSQAGYKAAVTTEIGFNDNHSDLLALNRIDAQPPIIDFLQYASGFEIMKNRIRNFV